MKNIRNKVNIKRLVFGFVGLILPVFVVGCGSVDSTTGLMTLPQNTNTISTTEVITEIKYQSTIEVYGFVDSVIYIGETYTLPTIMVLENNQVTTDYYTVLDDSLLDINTPGSYFVTLEIRREEIGLLATKVATITVIEQPEEIDYSPTIIGAKDLTVRVNDEDIDWKEGITVIDPVNGDITGRLNVDDSFVDIDTIGNYPLIYWVENIRGYQDQVTVQVNVVFLEEFYQLPNEFFITKINDLYGVYNIDGSEVIPVIYNDVKYLNEGIIRLSTEEIDVYYNLHEDTYVTFDKIPEVFYNGVSLFTENEKFGYISSDNEIIVPAIYTVGNDFDEDGYALVAISGNSYGYIDLQGEVVIDLIYSFINPLLNNVGFMDQLFLVEEGFENLSIINSDGDEIIEINSLTTFNYSVGDETYILVSTEKGDVFISSTGELLTDGEDLLYYYQTFNAGVDQTPVYLLRTETESKYYTVASSKTLELLETDIRDFGIFDSSSKKNYYVVIINNDIYAYDKEMNSLDYVDCDAIPGYTWLVYLDVLPSDTSMISYGYQDDELNDLRILFYFDEDLMEFNQFVYLEVTGILDTFIFMTESGTEEFEISYTIFNQGIVETFKSGEINRITFNDEGFVTCHEGQAGVLEKFYWKYDGTRLYPDSYMGEIEEFDNYLIATRHDPLNDLPEDKYQLLDKTGELILTNDKAIVPVNAFAVMVYQEGQVDNNYLIYNVLTKSYSKDYYEDAEYLALASGYLVSSVSHGVTYISLLNADFTKVIDKDITDPVIYEDVILSYKSLSTGNDLIYLLLDNSFVFSDYDEIYYADELHLVFNMLGNTYIYDLDSATQTQIATGSLVKVERIDEESFAVDFPDRTSIYRTDTDTWYVVSLPGNANYIGLSDDYAVFGIGTNLFYLTYDFTFDSYSVADTFTVTNDISVVDDVIVYDYGYYFDIGNSTLYRYGDPLLIDVNIPNKITIYDDTLFTFTDAESGAISYYTLIDVVVYLHGVIENQTTMQLAPNGRYYFNKISTNYYTLYNRNQTTFSYTLFVKQPAGNYSIGYNLSTRIAYLDDDIMVTESFGIVTAIYFDPLDGSMHLYDTQPTGIVSLEDHRFMYGDVYEIEYHGGLVYVNGDMSHPYDSLDYASYGMLQGVNNGVYDYYLDGVLIYEDGGIGISKLTADLYLAVKDNIYTVFDLTQKYLEVEATSLSLLNEEFKLFKISDGSHYGVIDLNGNIIIDSIYTGITISDNYILVVNNGIYTMYSFEGVRILPEYFSEIKFVRLAQEE